jgi:FkbM family methyltransferase
MGSVELLGRLFFSLSTPIKRTITLGIARNALLTVITSEIFSLITRRKPYSDPEFLSFLPEINGQVVLEVGANRGGFTRLLCEYVGPEGLVVAFEPNPLAYGVLRANLRNKKNLIALKVGLGSSICPAASLFISRGPFSTGTTAFESPRAIFSIDCRFVTLDHIMKELNIHNLDALFIDVEGGELDVVKGGESTIYNLHPKILVECHRKIVPTVEEEINDWLSRAGYSRESVYQTERTATYLFEPTGQPHATTTASEVGVPP